jgi:hypothetical protein
MRSFHGGQITRTDGLGQLRPMFSGTGYSRTCTDRPPKHVFDLRPMPVESAAPVDIAVETILAGWVYPGFGSFQGVSASRLG